MEMPRFTNSFKGGMNKDISPNEYPNTCYLDATNYRVIVDESGGMSTAALATPKGNLASFTLPTNIYYLGHVALREKLVILAKNTSGVDLRPDKIYVLALSDIIASTNRLVGGTDLIYEQDLNFNISNPIRVVGNYENIDVQKIYWVDGINPLRHLNIVSNTEYNNLSTLDPELLTIIPNHTYGSFELSEIPGGHLKAGRIQYAYQLYSISGTETMFSPPSPLYNLSASGVGDGIDFVGSEIETEINKSIRVTITLDALVTATFNRIRLVALEYETYGDVPTVRVVAELELGRSVVSFVDSGNSIGELVLEEFQVIRNEITPTTIETKNNYLFAANITQSSFDIDELVDEIVPGAFLDTRAYRWRYVQTDGGDSIASGSQILNESSDPVAQDDARNTGYGEDCFEFAVVPAFFETAWELNITIGAVAHGLAQAPQRTVTGISSINGLGSTVRLRSIEDGLWTTGGLTLDFNGVTIQSWNPTTGILKIRGDKYYYSPDDLAGEPYYKSYPTDFDGKALTQFSYTYTYSYTVPVTTTSFYESVINKPDILGNIPGISPIKVIDSGTGIADYDSVAEKDDAINTYNNISNDTIVVDHHQFKFKHGLDHPPLWSDLGGTGKYISFEFIDEQLDNIGTLRSIAGSPGNNYLIDPYALTDSYANPQTVIDFTSYQRDEVYRFALELYDLKGRPSFAKWIADIRFPDISEFMRTSHLYSGNHYQIAPISLDSTMNGLALGIKFTINWGSIDENFPGLLDQISGFQIVRAPRTELDCTIKAQGLIVPTHDVITPAGLIKDSNYSSFNVTGAFDYNTGGVVTSLGATVSGTNSNINQTLVELISPEIAINKNLIIDTSDDFLEVIGNLELVSKGAIVVATDQISYTVAGMAISALPASPAYKTDRRRVILDGFISYPEAKSPTSRMVGSDSFTPRGYNDDLDGVDPAMTYKGTSLVAKISSKFDNIVGTNTAAGDEKALYGRYRRSLGHSAYGGATYTERSYTTYISANIYDDSIITLWGGTSKAVQTIATPYAITSYEVWGGDTYISPFNFLKLFFDYNAEYATTSGEHSGQVLVAFPTESRINLNYKLDNIPKYFTTPIATPIYYLAEKYSIGIAQYPNGYPDGNDLYRYNSAYSAENISKIFIPRPFDFRESKTSDVMIVASEKKYNGEYSDSWLKFKFNNYIELEGEYGAITRIINSNERLMAFQPRAIAILSVLERELVETNNIATLAVGTGGILSRYDYVTRLAGSSWYDAIASTESGIYFYDDKNVIIYRIVDSLEPISDTKGMKSYFESTPAESLISAYDRDNREVLFSSSIPLIIRYGTLYNWYAATDVRNIANVGWHIPTSDNMVTLRNHLDPINISDPNFNIAGGQMKEVGFTNWNSPNTGATNSSGFTAKGAGWKYGPYGSFNAFKDTLYLWNTYDAGTYAGVAKLVYDDEVFHAGSNIQIFKNDGLSIRLVKDSTTLIPGETGVYTGNDGQVYKTICIGTQEWLSENLNETKYRESFRVVLGAMYNWYAATNVKNIASVDWHVPTLTELQTLMLYLDPTGIGYSNSAGGKLKEAGLTYWTTPNTGATNEVGFNGRGAGYRINSFYNNKLTLAIWTSTGYSVYGHIGLLSYNNATLNISYLSSTNAWSFSNGISIRLMKNTTTLSHGEIGTYVGNDGKIYRTICIGTQEWLADNLAETKYRDGTLIPEVTDSVAWNALTTGAMCYYDNNIDNAIVIGSDIPLVTSDTTWSALTTGAMCYYDNDISYSSNINEVGKNTLVFSGFLDAFSGFYSLNSGVNHVKNYISFDKYLLSSLDSRIFYLHNVGNYNQYYGEYQTSTLTLITNPLKNNVVTFHTIDWLTDLTTLGVETIQDLVLTFDTLRITNTHQDTGTLALADWITSEDLKRRFRKWRINTFRDSTDEGRIRDSWIKSHFTWEQTSSNKKLVVHPIEYLYLTTKIR